MPEGHTIHRLARGLRRTLGADALGFIFAPGSPRQVTPETVGAILHRLPAGVLTVGVFRDEQKERVVEVVNTLGLGGAQLHGREPLSDVRYIRRRVPFVIQGFTAGDPALAAVANGPIDIVLIDADQPGSGTAFDWALADAVPPGVRLLLARRWWTWVLAGVAVAGLALHCWWFAPQVTGANPPPADGADRLVVMTANIAQEDGDAIELVRIAGEEHVDLLVVEEISAADLADMERSGIADLLPYRVGRPASGGAGTMVFSMISLECRSVSVPSSP